MDFSAEKEGCRTGGVWIPRVGFSPKATQMKAFFACFADVTD
jgi:hypothetical protein